MSSKVTKYSQQVDASFPTKGTDNSTHGFQNNFKQIKLGLDTVADEITALQNEYATLTGLFNLDALSKKVDLVNGVVKLNQLPYSSTTSSGITQLTNIPTTSLSITVPAATLNSMYSTIQTNLPLKADLVNGAIPDSQLNSGTVSNIGVIQLIDTFTSTSLTLAPTADSLNQLFTVSSSNLSNKVDLVNGIVPHQQLVFGNTATYGVIQLTDSYANTSTTLAPTSNAVKTVNDLIVAEFSSKADLVNGVVPSTQLPTATTTSIGLIQLTNSYNTTSTTITPSSYAVSKLVNDVMAARSTPSYTVDVGAVNTYNGTYTPTITSVADGLVLKFKASTSNTGAATFSPDGITAAPIVSKFYHLPLTGKEIAANGDVWVQWNSSIAAWVLIESSGALPAERVYTTTTSTLSINNGSIQNVSISTTSTLTVDLINGQSLLMMIQTNGYSLNTSGFTVPDGFTLDPLNINAVMAMAVSTSTYLVSSGAYVPTWGQVWSWGSGISGTNSPVLMATSGNWWTQIASGVWYVTHYAGINTDGSLWTWGENGSGQLGTGDRTARTTPTQLSVAGDKWTQVACGQYFTAAIKTDGTLWTWGRNNVGQLGDGTTVDKSSPVQTIAGGTNWKQVACGYRHMASVKTDGTLWMWGWNYLGQLGNNTNVDKSSPIQTIAGGTNWKQVASGQYHTAAIKTDGTLWAWGNNVYGQLGDNTSTPRSSPVQTAAAGSDWKQVSTEYQHTFALKTDGSIWGWGRNTYGQLGDNSTGDKYSPVQTIAGGTNWKQVACGYRHTAAIKTDGTLWAWGDDSFGQIGDGTDISKSSPVQTISSGNTWKFVNGGMYQTIAIR